MKRILDDSDCRKHLLTLFQSSPSVRGSIARYFDFDEGVDDIEGDATRPLINLAWASRCYFSGLGHRQVGGLVFVCSSFSQPVRH